MKFQLFLVTIQKKRCQISAMLGVLCGDSVSDNLMIYPLVFFPLLLSTYSIVMNAFKKDFDKIQKNLVLVDLTKLINLVSSCSSLLYACYL